MKNTSRILLTIILGVAVIATYLYSHKNHVEIHTVQNQFTTSVAPLYIPDISVDEYPVTSVKPTETLYFTTLVKEQIDRFSQKFTSLFFADKRASEMQKWGDELSVLKPLKDSDVRLDSLLKWWRRTSLISWGNTTVYGSWESELARYAISIQDYKNSITDMSTRASLISTMLRDQEGITTTIKLLNKDEETTKYLINLQNEVFSQLEKDIQIPQSVFNPYRINYPVDMLGSIDEFGTYTAAVNVPSSTSRLADIQLQLNNITYTAQDKLQTDSEGHTSLIFRDLPITKTSHLFSLLIPESLLYEPTNWQAFSSQHSVYKYGYTATITNPITDTQYLLRYGDIHDKSLLSVNLEYTDPTNNKIQTATIFESETPFHSVAHYLKFSSPVNRIKDGKLIFTILSKNILTTEELQNYQLSVIPIIAPAVKLTRTDETLVKETLQKNDNMLFFTSLTIYIFVVFFLWMPLSYLSKKITTLQISEHKLIRALRHHVKTSIRSAKKLWLTLALLIVIVDICIPDKRLDVLVLMVVLLWILTLIGYNIPSNFNFFVTLILLVPYLVFMFIDKTDTAEKIAVYIYVSFTIGLLHSATLLLKKSPVSEEVDKLEDESFHFIRIFLHQLYIIALSFYTFVMKGVHAYFVIPPKSTYDKKMNILKAIILVFVICMIASTGILTVKFIKSEIRKKQRTDQDPVIVKVEPTIVYRATKILIKGRNLGWNENGNVKLMNGKDEVVPDVWTDTRIIFTVPLQWKVGVNNIRIEKKVFWDGQEITAVSKIIPIKLINAGSTFTPDDDAYFEQLKHIDPEVLKLNGYDSNEQK